MVQVWIDFTFVPWKKDGRYCRLMKKKCTILQQALHINKVICQMLVQRNIFTYEPARIILQASAFTIARSLVDEGYGKAVDRIEKAITNGKRSWYLAIMMWMAQLPLPHVSISSRKFMTRNCSIFIFRIVIEKDTAYQSRELNMQGKMILP